MTEVQNADNGSISRGQSVHREYRVSYREDCSM